MLFARGHSVSLRGIVLLMGDIFWVALSIALAALLRLGWAGGIHYLWENELALALLIATYILVFYLAGLYERRTLTQKENLLISCVVSVMVALTLAVLWSAACALKPSLSVETP